MGCSLSETAVPPTSALSVVALLCAGNFMLCAIPHVTQSGLPLAKGLQYQCQQNTRTLSHLSPYIAYRAHTVTYHAVEMQLDNNS
jgi:hypothetical protein